MTKTDLLKFIHSAGFDWICDVKLQNGQEMIASKCNDSEDVWWRPIAVEGSGFETLFKGSIRQVYKHETILP